MRISVERFQDQLRFKLEAPDGPVMTSSVAVWDAEDDDLLALWHVVVDPWDLMPTGRELASVVYGQVPAGFQQSRPHGKAPELYEGHAYSLNVDGPCSGYVRFQGIAKRK